MIVARFFGAGDEKNLQRAVHTTVAFGLVAGVLMTGVGVALSPQILRWMDTPESVMRESVTYLQILFCGIFRICDVQCPGGNSAGCGRQQTSFVLSDRIVCDQSGVGSVVYHRISYRSGRCGGCNVISQIVSALLCFWQLLRTKESYGLKIRKIRFDKGILVQIIKIGLPSGVQNSIIAFANVIVQSNINAFGEMAMAGYGAYTKVEGFGFLPINSFTMH